MQLKRDAKDASNRLDKFLCQKFPAYSRSFLKSQIQQGNVLVNGKIKKPSYILKPIDKIEINIIAPAKAILQPNPDIKLKIIYEDENIIAIDKPAGISAHPSRSGQNDTIANALLAYYPPIKNVGDKPELRPGIVHRLDKDTSGLMVVAKNQKTFDWLKRQFAERRVVKKYTALVTGNIKKDKGIINKPIGKTKDFRKRTTIPLKEQKEAVTHYKVLRYFFKNHPPSSDEEGACPPNFSMKSCEGEGGGVDSKQHPLSISLSTEGERKKSVYTLLEAEPKTGRTHQIRVHFASIGHPIAGDALYGFKRQIPPKGLKRQFLHASYLKFSLPNDRIIELNSELPKELQKIINTLSQARK